MAILIPLVFAVGIGVGFIVAFAGGYVGRLLGGKDRKELALTKKNLRIAEVALRKVANPVTGNPALEADLALSEIETNSTNYLEGR